MHVECEENLDLEALRSVEDHAARPFVSVNVYDLEIIVARGNSEVHNVWLKFSFWSLLTAVTKNLINVYDI